MAVSPPFSISETLPADSDLISIFPSQEHPFRDTVESWLAFLSDPATGLLKASAFAFPLTITNAGAGSFLILESTDVGAGAGPNLELYRNSASPLAADLIGGYYFYGEDSAGNKQEYGLIYGQIDDPTSTSEDGTIVMRVTVAGVVTNRITMNAAGVTLGGVTTTGAINTGALGVTGAIVASGAITSGATITSGGGVLSTQTFGSTTATVILASSAAGTILLRPNGSGSSVGQTSIDASGNMIAAGTGTFGGSVGVTGNVTASGSVQSTGNIFGNGSAGTLNFRPNGIGSSSNQMTYTAAGNLTAAGDITASSDRRLKKSISPLNHQWANDMVKEVQPMTFLRKRSDQRGIGFIAQDVQAYAPEIVHEDEHTHMLSLAYPNMVAILWAVVQDLQKKVHTLEFPLE